jgi:hypothetical protein
MSKSFRESFESQVAFRRAAAYVITHPKKSGHAVVNIAYPADGAGVLKVYVKDWFAGAGRFSMATAGGYGYDKLTAALSRTDGVDGVKLYDHCETPAKGSEDARALMHYKRLTDIIDCNAVDMPISREKRLKLAKKHGIRCGYFETGLERLSALGYHVIQAL